MGEDHKKVAALVDDTLIGMQRDPIQHYEKKNGSWKKSERGMKAAMG